MANLVTWFASPTATHVGLAVVYVVLMAIVARRSQIDAWCMKNPRLAGFAKLIRAISPDLLLFVQGIALVVLKRLPISYQVLVSAETPPPALPANDSRKV